MKQYLDFLTTTPLFSSVSPEDIAAMLDCLSIHRRHFEKESYIFTTDSPATELGLVLTGSVHLIKEDYWGNRAIITKINPGDVFGEAASCAAVDKMPVSAVAANASDILFLNYRKVTSICSNACPFHTRLIQNMLGMLAKKNLILTEKITHLVKRSTREKLLSYFSEQAEAAHSNEFVIPFNRQELADYLSVDRSAMSSELGRLRDEGILSFHKNSFQLH